MLSQLQGARLCKVSPLLRVAHSPVEVQEPGLWPSLGELWRTLLNSELHWEVSQGSCWAHTATPFLSLILFAILSSSSWPIYHNGVITHLEPDILECEVKWALESITMNKASGGDGIPVGLFQILKDDAVKVRHSICQKIWKTQQWPQD